MCNKLLTDSLQIFELESGHQINEQYLQEQYDELIEPWNSVDEREAGSHHSVVLQAVPGSHRTAVILSLHIFNI